MWTKAIVNILAQITIQSDLFGIWEGLGIMARSNLES